MNENSEAMTPDVIQPESCADESLNAAEAQDGNAPTDEDTAITPEDSGDSASELDSLRAEVSALRAQLEGERAFYGRMTAECAEFSELYPSVPLSSVPDTIWESVKRGVPIAAAYALYEKKDTVARSKAELINNANSLSSSGPIDSPRAEEYFSPAEVKAMSAAEVRANYSTIIRSMSKWH